MTPSTLVHQEHITPLNTEHPSPIAKTVLAGNTVRARGMLLRPEIVQQAGTAPGVQTVLTPQHMVE